MLSKIAELDTSSAREGNYPKVAILDSGIDADLARKEGLVLESSFVHALNFSGAADKDDLGHGTAMALLLTANKNGFGMLGALPGLAILPIKVGTKAELEAGLVPFERIRSAVQTAANQGAKIVAMSLSNNDRRWPKAQMQALLDEYQDKLLFIVAAGNDGMKLDLVNHCSYVPICNTSSNLLVVGASDYAYSNRGNPVHFNLESKSYQWTLIKINKSDLIYELKAESSTSVAVPKAVAVAALAERACPACRPTQIAKLLIEHFHTNKPKLNNLIQEAKAIAHKAQ